MDVLFDVVHEEHGVLEAERHLASGVVNAFADRQANLFDRFIQL